MSHLTIFAQEFSLSAAWRIVCGSFHLSVSLLQSKCLAETVLKEVHESGLNYGQHLCQDGIRAKRENRLWDSLYILLHFHFTFLLQVETQNESKAMMKQILNKRKGETIHGIICASLSDLVSNLKFFGKSVILPIGSKKESPRRGSPFCLVGSYRISRSIRQRCRSQPGCRCLCRSTRSR